MRYVALILLTLCFFLYIEEALSCVQFLIYDFLCMVSNVFFFRYAAF